MTKMHTIALAIAGLALALPAAAQTTSPGTSTTSEMKQGAKNAALTAKVHTALAKDVSLKTLAINVDSSGNSVILKGQVDSDATKTRAEQVAKQVEGVSSVDNQLTIKPKS